ncbi:MAG: division/cell wall cluster transcriptional repressor MraZ [Candidatus Dojkabacteria bacterium]
MLIGEYSVQIGEKNRIAIPKRLRDNLEGKLFLTRGYENCLILVDENRWSKLISEINKNPLLSLGVRDTKRFILGGAVELEPDSQGRIVISDALKEFATIQEKVTFIGVGEWAEVWSEQKWKDKLNNLSKNVSDLAEKLQS